MKIEVRHLEMEDYMALKESMMQAYQTWGAYWRDHQIEHLLDIFPEGQICINVDGKLVGVALSIIVDYEKFSGSHTYAEVTGDYKFSTHNPDGDVLYGIEVFIHPDYRGKRLARRLYDARKEMCEKLNLRGILAGARMPMYSKMADKLSPRDYVRKVKENELYDSTLSFQFANDFHVKKILDNYMPGDLQSKEYAVLIEWNNIYYEPLERFINEKKRRVRLSLVQWQMRSFKDFEAVCEQVEFFVDAASAYKADFILFPEYFHAPLMSEFNHLSEIEAIRDLSKYTDAFRKKFSELAVSYNSNIISGSFPKIIDGKLHNMGYLCKRNGEVEEYYKLHVTPDEKQAWGMSGGDRLRVFDTDCGKIGILICYDVEFPELSRLLADKGMDILFVPFLTDTQNAYNRVRFCAQARAIENECFVAIAGSVGNLPKVHNMDIQYAQSAVFTPNDFAFPSNGVKGEATPNTETNLIVDVDLNLLKELHYHGSVRNLKDRRLDLYHLTSNFGAPAIAEKKEAANKLSTT